MCQHNFILCVMWLIHVRDMTHSYMWNDSLICVISYSVFFLCCVPSRAWHDTFICGHNSIMWTKRLIHTCKTTHLSLQYDLKVCCSHCFLLLCVRLLFNKYSHTSTLLFHLCDITLAHTCMSGLMTLHMCDRTHSHVWHDSFTSVAWLIYEINTASHAWYRVAKTHRMP